MESKSYLRNCVDKITIWSLKSRAVQEDIQPKIHHRVKGKPFKSKSKHKATHKNKNKFKNRIKHSSIGCFLFCVINILSFILINNKIENNLPYPQPESIESYKFSEERALIHIQELASFGIRTVGSYSNEILSPNYIINYIQNINKTLTNQHKKSNHNLILNKIE
eukprot:60044_1